MASLSGEGFQLKVNGVLVPIVGNLDANGNASISVDPAYFPLGVPTTFQVHMNGISNVDATDSNVLNVTSVSPDKQQTAVLSGPTAPPAGQPMTLTLAVTINP